MSTNVRTDLLATMVERLATKYIEKHKNTKTQKHFILLASRFVAQLTIGHQNMRAQKTPGAYFDILVRSIGSRLIVMLPMVHVYVLEYTRVYSSTRVLYKYNIISKTT